MQSRYPFNPMKNRKPLLSGLVYLIRLFNFLPLPPPKGQAPSSFIPAW